MRLLIVYSVSSPSPPRLLCVSSPSPPSLLASPPSLPVSSAYPTRLLPVSSQSPRRLLVVSADLLPVSSPSPHLLPISSPLLTSPHSLLVVSAGLSLSCWSRGGRESRTVGSCCAPGCRCSPNALSESASPFYSLSSVMEIQRQPTTASLGGAIPGRDQTLPVNNRVISLGEGTIFDICKVSTRRNKGEYGERIV